jgi:uncharacterized membrane protein
MTAGDSSNRMNDVISDLLKYGVIVSAVIIAAGVVLTFANTPESFPSSLQLLVSTNYGEPYGGISGLASGLASGSPASVLQLGLIVLLATPVARVVASVILFAAERDGRYVAITLFVLCVLLVSTFFIGPLEATANH